jgi:hypothetical protein
MLDKNWSWKRDERSLEELAFEDRPALKKLCELTDLLADEQAYLDYMDRNGSSGRAVEYLRDIVAARQIEIRALRGAEALSKHLT